MRKYWLIIAMICIASSALAWTHGGGGLLLTDVPGVLLTNASGDLLTR